MCLTRVTGSLAKAVICTQCAINLLEAEDYAVMNSVAWRLDGTHLVSQLPEEQKRLNGAIPPEEREPVRDNLSRIGVNLNHKARGDPRQTDDEEIINAPKDLSQIGLESLEFKDRVRYSEAPPIYIVRKAVRDPNHPEQLAVEEGDLVLKKFAPTANFARWTYEEDEYLMRDKFPHIGDGTWLQMRDELHIYVRKLGVKEKSGLRQFDWQTIGWHSVQLIDTHAGYVPLKHLEKVESCNFSTVPESPLLTAGAPVCSSCNRPTVILVSSDASTALNATRSAASTTLAGVSIRTPASLGAELGLATGPVCCRCWLNTTAKNMSQKERQA